jgi:hypothetical protein
MDLHYFEKPYPDPHPHEREKPDPDLSEQQSTFALRGAESPQRDWKKSKERKDYR